MNSASTTHKIIIGAAQNMEQIQDNSIELVVTSPPYPMIEMWDEIMARQNPEINEKLLSNEGNAAFELMHQELDKVWSETERILIPGGFACINIGDATRSINGECALYANHSQIISAFVKFGFSNLPNIIWRKQTNAPNKFMGSGMLPAGAYVKLEHEWISIFRKGRKRKFTNETEKTRRRESSFFWEERNIWFSDLWEIKGARQVLTDSETRKRSTAYPLEIPYRLINMYSLKNDTVLDPFTGTGVTAIAAIASQRNSISYEIDPTFSTIISETIQNAKPFFYNKLTDNRLFDHATFIREREKNPKKLEIKHFNENINAKVMTKQEAELDFHYVENMKALKKTSLKPRT
ncbi:MAG: DNA modification methylase [Spirosomataceae bacterium]|jgi:DNA modification methylase